MEVILWLKGDLKETVQEEEPEPIKVVVDAILQEIETNQIIEENN